MITIYRGMAQACSAGVPLPGALETLAEHADRARAEALRGVAARIGGGMALSEAMRRYPQTFVDWQRQLVAIGEETGRLDLSLMTVAEILEEQKTLMLQTLQRLAYPMLLVTLAPLILSAPVAVSSGPGAYLRAALVPLMKLYGTLGVVYLVWSRWLRHTDYWKHLKVFDRYKKIQFCTAFSALVRTGLGVPRAIELAGGAAGLDDAVVRAAAAPSDEELVERLKRLGVFNGRELGELKVAELTGETPLALARILSDAKGGSPL